MKKINLLLTGLAIFSICMTGCKSSGSKDSKASAVAGAEANTNEKQTKGRYALKSGIVEYQATIMNMKSKITIYFDDFGAKETSVSEMEMMGISIKTQTIKKDGFIYTIDFNNKTCKKTSMSTSSGDIDFENLTESVQKDMNIQKVGDENYQGKSCQKYTIDSEKYKLKGSYLVWKGIALKTDVDMGGMKMVMNAVKFEENTDIPASTFEIPADIKME